MDFEQTENAKVAIFPNEDRVSFKIAKGRTLRPHPTNEINKLKIIRRGLILPDY